MFYQIQTGEGRVGQRTLSRTHGQERTFPQIHPSSFIFALWREKALSALEMRVVRFRNDEIVRELSAVVGKIRAAIRQ
ncbi:MAG: DUF559 domain-containing protein [Anaerolineales bacterium]|nr:DUF559 domain-containing protein [Anaerolineales bacterium]